jgi:SHS2 domain-containing protein
MSTLPSITVLEHTADIGLHIQASTLQELFVAAAHGMMQILCTPSPQNGGTTHKIHVSGADAEQQLVNWLSELNFLFQTRQFLFAGANVADLRLDECDVMVYGETIDRYRHTIRTEIKAVTYHRIYVRQSQEGVWEARVYFDL